jgi:hypothetical protein
MKAKRHIEQEVDKTLNSLDGVKRAVANPYLFTRIKVRLEKEEGSIWSRATQLISRPAVAVAALVLAISINLAVFFEYRPEVPETGQEDEQVFASEYNLSSDTIYDSTIEPNETVHPK